MYFIDLAAQREFIKKEIYNTVFKVISEGCYILGPEVKKFEKKIASYIGVKHVISCANGTDALLMSLMAGGIGLGHAVFCPSFTFAATAEVIALVGAEPVFIDVKLDTYNINCEDLQDTIYMIKKEGRLEPKAIIAVDLFGLSADYKKISKIAKKENLILIEDAAQSVGAKNNGIMCGAFGNMATTSFYPTKPLGCYGDGGAIFTDDDNIANILRSIRFHGKGKTQYDNIRIGTNSRLDTIQAAILIEKLKIFEDEMNKRIKIANIYSKNLYNFVRVPKIPINNRSSYAQYTIFATNRDKLQNFLKKKLIPSFIYYTKPLHLQIAYKKFSRSPNGLQISELLSSKVLSLPMHPYLSIKDQHIIIKNIRKFYT